MGPMEEWDVDGGNKMCLVLSSTRNRSRGDPVLVWVRVGVKVRVRSEPIFRAWERVKVKVRVRVEVKVWVRGEPSFLSVGEG